MNSYAGRNRKTSVVRGIGLRLVAVSAFVLISISIQSFPCSGGTITNAVVVAGKNNRIYVGDNNAKRIQEFDERGTLIRSWGIQGAGIGELFEMSGIAADGNGKVYVSGLWPKGDNLIQVYSEQGVLLRTLKIPDGVYPRAIAVNPSGKLIYVIVFHKILIFSDKGKLVGQFGRRGHKTGEFRLADGIAVGKNGTVYVVDALASRVYRFSSSGKLIKSWGGHGKGRLSMPSDVSVDEAGYVHLLDGDRIIKYDSNGKYISDWQFNDSQETMYLGFLESIAAASHGETFMLFSGVPESDVWRIDSHGRLLAQWKVK